MATRLLPGSVNIFHQRGPGRYELGNKAFLTLIWSCQHCLVSGSLLLSLALSFVRTRDILPAKRYHWWPGVSLFPVPWTPLIFEILSAAEKYYSLQRTKPQFNEYPSSELIGFNNPNLLLFLHLVMVL